MATNLSSVTEVYGTPEENDVVPLLAIVFFPGSRGMDAKAANRSGDRWAM